MSKLKRLDNEPEIDRHIIVSNRLPVILAEENEGEWQAQPGSGGLVTALAPVLSNRGGLWIGWPGTPVRRLTNPR